MSLLPSSAVRVFPPPTCGFQCSALRLVLTPIMASADFCRGIPAPLDASSTEVTLGALADLPGYDAPTFTLMPVGYTLQRSVQVSGFDDIGRLTPLQRLISASCSSGQRFAFGFLQIRSRPRHPCRSANSSPCRASRGLSPPSECALPSVPRKKHRRGRGDIYLACGEQRRLRLSQFELVRLPARNGERTTQWTWRMPLKGFHEFQAHAVAIATHSSAHQAQQLIASTVTWPGWRGIAEQRREVWTAMRSARNRARRTEALEVPTYTPWPTRLKLHGQGVSLGIAVERMRLAVQGNVHA